MSFSRIFSLAFLAVIAFAPTAVLGANDTPPSASIGPLAMNSPEAPSVKLQFPPAPIFDQSFAASSVAATTPNLVTDTTLDQGDLWQRIRNGFAMPELKSRLIARHELWYKRHPEYVERMTERSRRYLYFIMQEVEKRGMPTEIALLPMIESGFNPEAYSVSRASGIWQFIPSTGKKYGMDQNWWYDGRRDIVSATQGALDYLQKLHDQFGDWALALAAYNCGEGGVQRAIERNRRRHRPTDYQHLRLPRETRHYVPKLMAIKNIVSEPEKFGLTLQAIPDRPYFAAINTGRHIDVKLAAELAEIPLDEFNALNPAHDRPVILQGDDSDVILLPVDKVATFRANLENYDKPLVSWQAYKTKRGESLDKIAARFGLTTQKLKSVNGLYPRDRHARGQTLLVPRSDEEADSEFEAFNTHLPPSFDYSRMTVHIVRRGETLSGIARRYHVRVSTLKHYNHNSTLIRPGQRLLISGGRKRVASYRSRKSSGKVHVVRRGETLSSIARHHHVSVAALKRVNGNSTLIRPGQRLNLTGI